MSLPYPVAQAASANAEAVARILRRSCEIFVTAVPTPRASALGIGHAPGDSAEVRRVALGVDERVPSYLRDNYRSAARHTKETDS